MSRLVLAWLLVGGVAACADDPKLKVTGLGDDKGNIDGELVVVKGNRFVADGPRNVKVFFGGKQGSFQQFLSDHEMLVRAPPGKPDETVDVTIYFEPGGKITLNKAYKYVERGGGPSVDDLNTADKKKKQ